MGLIKKRSIKKRSVKTYSRQNFNPSLEKVIQQHITAELQASIIYMDMYAFFKQETVAFDNIAGYFLEASTEERKHALMFVDYLIERGGQNVLETIPFNNKSFVYKKPQNRTKTIYLAFKYTLDLEKSVNARILNMHKLASKLNDPHFQNFLETNFIDEQVETQNKLADLMSQAQRSIGSFEQEVFNKEFEKPAPKAV